MIEGMRPIARAESVRALIDQPQDLAEGVPVGIDRLEKE
jgi:hypothetical protein